MAEKVRLQCDISLAAMKKLEKLCDGRPMKGAMVEAAINYAAKAKFKPFIIKPK